MVFLLRESRTWSSHQKTLILIVDAGDCPIMTSRQSHRRLPTCSPSTKFSRKLHESKHRHKRSERKSSHSSSQNPALHRLHKRVSHMVHKDRKRKHSIEPLQESKLPSCGCPNNCEPELEKLRKYVNSLIHLLPKNGVESSLCQLEHLVSNPVNLLSEAWITLGASHLRDLVSVDLLAICARREQRDKRHSLPDNATNNETATFRSSPPFLSLDSEFSENVTAGVRELWKRSLQELSELSEGEIQAVLSGQFEDSTKHPRKSSKQPVEQDDKKSPSNFLPAVPVESGHSTVATDSRLESNPEREERPQKEPSRHTTEIPDTEKPTLNISCDSSSSKDDPISEKCNAMYITTKSVDVRVMVQQEITELEMRARAIRSMLKAGSNSST
ncbi:hypothetical protein D915_008907 [Fasciola hepatica]|uniref:Uncharacterized protein n=1 Tax=Fasciola hepatica TaxID=6192 RepID=A0A4E0QYA8_FASHE|nr:hypothetical protein D915_008907 [Fasciola hepatica]